MSTDEELRCVELKIVSIVIDNIGQTGVNAEVFKSNCKPEHQIASNQNQTPTHKQIPFHNEFPSSIYF